MNNKTDPDFIHFLQSMVNLDALHEMTTDLDNDLKDSQTVMNEIKGMIEALPPRVANPGDGCMQHEDIANLLEAGTPHLLMPDMEVNIDLNLDDVIATMKSYVEDIKKNFTVSDPLTQPKQSPKELESLELEKYASNLDHLCKKLTHLKLTKKAEKKSDVELEAKLSLLCEDVQTFNKVLLKLHCYFNIQFMFYLAVKCLTCFKFHYYWP